MSIYVDAERIKQYAIAAFRAVGLSEDHSTTVADNLVQAELRGTRSHGLVQVRRYVEAYQSGESNCNPDIKILRETDTTIAIDADHGPGAPVGKFAMEKVIEKAKRCGIAAGTVKNGTHYGIAAYYAMEALKEDLIGFAFTNAGLIVAPFGGYARELGTNPICVAAPADRYRPIVFDAATSEGAYNKVVFAQTEHRQIPLNWAVDRNGVPTDDPTVMLEEGALLPFGGYKGYGLAVIVNILTGLLSGGSIAQDPDGQIVEDPLNICYNFGALDISRFTEVDVFKKTMDLFIDRLKSSPRTLADQPIYAPGELEFLREEAGRRNGLELYEGVSGDLRYVGRTLGLSMTLDDCIL